MNLTALTDDDLNDLHIAVLTEREARQALASAEQAVQQVTTRYHQARDRATPEGQHPAWVQPTGAHDTYPSGYTVTHGGKTWTNTHPHNSWEPGTTNSQWTQQVEEPEPDPETGEPGFVAWGPGQDVKVGDVRTHDGHKWTAVVAHTTHEGWIPGPNTWSVWTDNGPI